MDRSPIGESWHGSRSRWKAIGVRLATWNVNSVKARLPRLLDWLAEAKPDIVCLQETKCTDALFPAAEVGELGYEVAAHGEGRWNGGALLSAVGLDNVSRGFPGEPGYEGEPGEPALIDTPGLRRPEARAVGANCGGIRVWSLYAPNGRTPESAHYAYKLAWFAALRDGRERGQHVGPSAAVLAGGRRRDQKDEQHERRDDPVRRIDAGRAPHQKAPPGRPFAEPRRGRDEHDGSADHEEQVDAVGAQNVERGRPRAARQIGRLDRVRVNDHDHQGGDRAQRLDVPEHAHRFDAPLAAPAGTVRP